MQMKTSGAFSITNLLKQMGDFMTMKLIPDVVKNTNIYYLSPNASALDAAQLMQEKSIGVVLVMDGTELKGIFSERDMITRVVAQGLDPRQTPLSQVMTPDVATVEPDTTATQALELMRDLHCRHLPILQAGKVKAMVSVRDLYAAVCGTLEKDLREKEAFIFSGGY
jgi:CBS domain-containing protein